MMSSEHRAIQTDPSLGRKSLNGMTERLDKYEVRRIKRERHTVSRNQTNKPEHTGKKHNGRTVCHCVPVQTQPHKHVIKKG